MTALPQHQYRDPALVYEQKEARSCKGCSYQHSEKLWGKVYTVCTKLLPNGKRRNHGKKCVQYKESE